MTRARVVLRDFGWVAIGVLCTADAVIDRRRLAAFTWGLVTGAHFMLALSIHRQRKEPTRGHREPEGGHRDHDTGTRRTDPAGAGPTGSTAGTGGAGAGQGSRSRVVAYNTGGTIQRVALPPAADRLMPGSEWYRSRGSAYAAQRLDHRSTDQTIRAWKRASIDVVLDTDEPRPMLIGPISGRYLAVDYGIAGCYPVAFTVGPTAYGHTDPAPRFDCTCGFYAVHDRTALDGPLDGGLATLEVELFGRVVRHEHGYRAGRQRVLAVVLDRTCHICLDHEATAVAVGLNNRVAEFFGVQSAWSGTICDDCQQIQQPIYAYRFTPAELAGALQTEVRWAAAA